jgi:hypothetical protein
MTSQPPSPNVPGKTRVQMREEARMERAHEAHTQARRMSERARGVGLTERVDKAKVKMNGQNVAQAIQTIQLSSLTDRDYFLLAEEFTRNRTGVLRAFGPVKRAVREAYLAEAELSAPDQPA